MSSECGEGGPLVRGWGQVPRAAERVGTPLLSPVSAQHCPARPPSPPTTVLFVITVPSLCCPTAISPHHHPIRHPAPSVPSHHSPTQPSSPPTAVIPIPPSHHPVLLVTVPAYPAKPSHHLPHHSALSLSSPTIVLAHHHPLLPPSCPITVPPHSNPILASSHPTTTVPFCHQPSHSSSILAPVPCPAPPSILPGEGPE